MRRFLFVMFAVGCFSFSSERAYACFCVTPEVPEAFKQANAVFLGEVVDIVEPKIGGTSKIQDRLFTIKFKVEKFWKGMSPRTREFSVLSAQGGFRCFAFPPMIKGQRYLVYANPAYGAEHWSVVTSCSRTTVFRFALDPRLMNPDAIDPFADMRMLDAIKGRAFYFW